MDLPKFRLEEHLLITSEPDKNTLETKITHSLDHQDIPLIIRKTAVIITHPYGILGGNMDNNVVKALYDYFINLGFITIRFNFRGVGQSKGWTSLKGISEQNDLKSICQYVLNPNGKFQADKLILVGYSYGSMCTCSIINEIPQIYAYISISYPYSVLWALTLWNSQSFLNPIINPNRRIPKFFIMGSRDQFTSADKLSKFIQDIPKPKELVIVQGVDHFWFGWEDTLIENLDRWFKKLLDELTGIKLLSPI